MNIEKTLAQWLDTQSATLTVGTNLFLTNLFNTDKEGVCVLLNRLLQATDTMDRALLQVVLFYRDYIVGRNLMETIVNLLDGRRGTIDGTWTVSGLIEFESMGFDQLNRNIFTISVEIAYKEA